MALEDILSADIAGSTVFATVAFALVIAVFSILAIELMTVRRIRVRAEAGESWSEGDGDGSLAHYRKRALRDLESAGMRLTNLEAMTIWVGCFMIPLLVGIVLGLSAPIAIGCGGVGAVAPLVWIRISRRGNNRRFEEDLGQAMPLIASNMRGGLPLRQALIPVSENLNEPLRGEFRQLNRDLDSGKAMDRAIEDMAERTENRDLVLFAASIRAQQQTGGNLADIVEQVGETIQARVELRRMVRSKTSQGRVTAIIMVAVPPVMALFLFFGNSMYHDFYSSGMGLITLAVCAVFELVGYFVTNKMCNIEAD